MVGNTRAQSGKRGLLARPLDALVFLLPMILLYEFAPRPGDQQVIASLLLRRFVELFGDAGMWAPGVIVIAILVATHVASGEPWVVRISEVGFMYIEAAALALPLVILNWAIPLAAAQPRSAVLHAALGIGAGVYEELVFRLILISMLVLIGHDLLRLRINIVAPIAILLAAAAFAAYHHQPIGPEPFDMMRFLFRSAAGAYLGVIFWYRGYGPAAGCHAAYNMALVALVSVYSHTPVS